MAGRFFDRRRAKLTDRLRQRTFELKLYEEHYDPQLRPLKGLRKLVNALRDPRQRFLVTEHDVRQTYGRPASESAQKEGREWAEYAIDTVKRDRGIARAQAYLAEREEHGDGSPETHVLTMQDYANAERYR